MRGGRVVDPSQGLDAVCDVLITAGVVDHIGGRLAPAGVPELDASGLVVAPGFIDMHVHLREPGFEYKETVESGTAAAAAGGFVAVACMANTDPVNDNPSVTEHVLKQARLCGHARVYPIAAISRGLAGAELCEFGLLRAAGAIALSDDGRPVVDPELMLRALQHAQHAGMVVIQHCQDLVLSGHGVMHEGEVSALLGVAGIPGAADDVMIARDLLLLEESGGRYHVAHLSTARGVELVAAGKERGLDVTTEVTPHHLLLTDRAVLESGLDPNWKMHPPLRSERDRQALLAALVDGTIDCIASDHAPHHADEKGIDFIDAPNGVVGLETTVSLCLDRLVRPGQLALARLIDALSCRPARVLGVSGGSLAPGAPGDLTLLDLEREVTVRPELFRSKSRNTPFSGWRLRGAPAGTVVAGRHIIIQR